MKKIVFLGCSSGIVSAIEALRNVDKESEVVILPLENNLPYERQLFADFLTKKISAQEVLAQPRSFYDEHKVQIIENKKIDRINFKRNIIFTEDKDQITYDHLVLTGLGEEKFPGVKGTNKAGVYSLEKFETIKELVTRIPFIETVIIQTSRLSGLQ